MVICFPVPGPPFQLEVLVLSCTQIKVGWQPPADPRGVLRSYYVYLGQCGFCSSLTCIFKFCFIRNTINWVTFGGSLIGFTRVLIFAEVFVIFLSYFFLFRETPFDVMTCVRRRRSFVRPSSSSITKWAALISRKRCDLESRSFTWTSIPHWHTPQPHRIWRH